MNRNKVVKKALVIDDNRQMADSLCQMLNLMNIQAQAIYGSRPALMALKNAAPDIIFLDINMPGLSGFEVLRFLLREPLLEKIPVVIVTSDDQEETTQRALRLGACSVIIKPVTIEALEKLIPQL